MNNNITLLYVDDEPMNLQLFKYTFQGKFNVLIADSGKEGLKYLKECPEISVVISDMKMPELSGIEFIKLAKKRYPDITYFVLTGYGESIDIQEALNSRLVSKCLSKPFCKEEIETSIMETVE
jgi:response regulator RpfG family c-di-GMP phosphodiesterase